MFESSTQVTLTDSEGLICGYYSMQQVYALTEDYDRCGDVVVLRDTPTTHHRLKLLRASFDNPGISPKQRGELVSLINGITKNRATLNQNESRTFVTRDENGVYLGMNTEFNARLRWPSARLKGPVIGVRATVPIIDARSFASRSLLEETGFSDRINASLEQARRYINKFDNKRNKGYWKGQSQITYRVLHQSDEPICCLPYGMLSDAFEEAWIVISNDTVQLVCRWTRQEVAARASKAIAKANLLYHEIAEPGSGSFTHKQYEKVHQKRSASSKTDTPLSSKPVEEPQTSFWEPRQVVRDRNGCFLGVYKLSEARRFWPEAYSKEGAIAVPNTVEFVDALFAISKAQNLEMQYAIPQYKNAAIEAAYFPRDRLDIVADEYWNAMNDTPVEVRYRSGIPIANLTPAELTEAFGTAWFMVSPQRAQLITYTNMKGLAKRAKEIERKNRPQGAATKATSKPKKEDGKRKKTGNLLC